MYYTIFKNQNTGKLWFKKYKTKAKQTRAVAGVVKLTYNSLYNNFSSLTKVKTKIKNENLKNKKWRNLWSNTNY